MSYIVCHRTESWSADAARRQAQVALASGLFEQFHCFAPTAVVPGRHPRKVPPVLMRLGELRGLIYRSDRGQCGRPRTFIHFFESPPLLTCDPVGERLHIVGGRYRVTPHGIEG